MGEKSHFTLFNFVQVEVLKEAKPLENLELSDT